MQSKLDSFFEALTNTAIGFIIALITQLITFHFYGLHTSWSANIQITLIFTIVSIIRSYCLRRIFNGRNPGRVLIALAKSKGEEEV